jgi:antitoxin MazE
MKVELARIGNSRGIRIPKPLIEQCGFGDQVELRVIPEGLVVAPTRRTPRSGWKESFRAAQAAITDPSPEDGPPSSFDHEEWQW